MLGAVFTNHWKQHRSGGVQALEVRCVHAHGDRGWGGHKMKSNKIMICCWRFRLCGSCVAVLDHDRRGLRQIKVAFADPAQTCGPSHSIQMLTPTAAACTAKRPSTSSHQAARAPVKAPAEARAAGAQLAAAQMTRPSWMRSEA
jgi:hypothetical protein